MFLALVCVRLRLCPLCLHLFIVCTHLAGDTECWAGMGGTAGDHIEEKSGNCDFRLFRGGEKKAVEAESPETTLE